MTREVYNSLILARGLGGAKNLSSGKFFASKQELAVNDIDYPHAGGLSGAETRALIRAGKWRRPTTGVAEGWVQANLVILPETAAADFQRFCELNPRACPLLEVTEPGSPEPLKLARGADLRVDVPRYRVYRHGTVVEEVENLLGLWRDDLVAFLLGCSFTAEAALRRAGVPLRHLELGRCVPMYRTNRLCQPSGRFEGPMVVSMRPIPEGLVEKAVLATEKLPKAHGGPIHIGSPRELGIADLSQPDYGDSVPVKEDELPVFWACGVTPQAVAEEAKIAFMITHCPGHMFVSDLRDEDLLDG